MEKQCIKLGSKVCLPEPSPRVGVITYFVRLVEINTCLKSMGFITHPRIFDNVGQDVMLKLNKGNKFFPVGKVVHLSASEAIVQINPEFIQTDACKNEIDGIPISQMRMTYNEHRPSIHLLFDGQLYDAKLCNGCLESGETYRLCCTFEGESPITNEWHGVLCVIKRSEIYIPVGSVCGATDKLTIITPFAFHFERKPSHYNWK